MPSAAPAPGGRSRRRPRPHRLRRVRPAGRGTRRTRRGRRRRGATTRAPEAAEERIREHEVSVLGKALDAALRSGDVEQWLGHFDLSDPDAEQQQRHWYAGVHAVPMDVREVHTTRMTVQTSTAVRGPRVELTFRHQVTGADPVPAVETYQVHVERRGEDLKIVEVNNVTEGQIGFPQLWNVGPIEVLQTGPDPCCGDVGLSLRRGHLRLGRRPRARLALNELPRPGADVGPVLRQQLDLDTEDFEEGYLDWLVETVEDLGGARAQDVSYGR